MDYNQLDNCVQTLLFDNLHMFQTSQAIDELFALTNES
jgi:hypothetical protein